MSNDDDLYGDLYGNDESGDFPGFDAEESEQKETKPAPEPVASSATSSVKPAVTEAKKPAVTTIPKEEPSAVIETKKDLPLTNPIPTFTEDSANSYSSNVASKYGVPQANNDGDNRPAQGFQRNPAGGDESHQGIETVGGNDSVRPSNMRDEGKMFVGGLNWDTTDDGLRNYFSQFGKVDACTIMRDPAGRSRGFAFLTFEDPAAVNKVMVQEHYLDGKIIDPKRAIPRTEHQRTVKMFVGGLAPTVTNDSMREYFSQFGKVIDSTVMVDRDSSRSKGFGFVTFDDQSGAERLFGMPGLAIDGKTIEVKMAQPRAGMAAERANANGGNQNNRGGAYDNNSYGGGGGGAGVGAGAGGNTPFDPQALATLYQRMAQLAGGAQGGMQWGMNGGMGMGGGMMGMNGGGMGGMGMMGGTGMGMGQGAGGVGMRGGYNGGMMNPGMDGGMGGGMNGHAGAGPMRGGNIPRGPAAMRGGAAGGAGGVPTGPSGGLGPARMGRGHQHNYHPYSR